MHQGQDVLAHGRQLIARPGSDKNSVSYMRLVVVGSEICFSHVSSWWMQPGCRQGLALSAPWLWVT